mmetsp:Transcript_21156/g.42179  ORF Transcript_21156/g.42179 Transcript_21156/m.42179 type:complete len:342 (+) Transcript_21156:96-1121(+)
MLPAHLRDALDPHTATAQTQAAVLLQPTSSTASLPANGLFLDHIDSGTCRGCGNLMQKLKKAVQCPCGLRYCVVRLRGKLLICSKQRAAFEELGCYCHCELANMGRCGCAACRKRKRRQQNNADNLERASQRPRTAPESAAEPQPRRVRALAVATGTARIVMLLPTHSWTEFLHTLQVALEMSHVSSVTDADGFAFTGLESIRDNDVLHVHCDATEPMQMSPALVSPCMPDMDMLAENDTLLAKDEAIVCPPMDEMDLLLADLLGAPLSAELDLDLAVLLHEQESLHERPPLRPPLPPPLVVAILYYLAAASVFHLARNQHNVDRLGPGHGAGVSAPVLVC